MLILTRRPDEFLFIEPAMTVVELFKHGPLMVRMLGIDGRQVRIGITAPQALANVRDELL